MTSVSPDDLLLMGKVKRPHGLRGLLRITSYGCSAESFPKGGRVFFRAAGGDLRQYFLLDMWPHKKAFLMKLRGVESIEEAEKLRDSDLFLEKSALLRDEDELFWHEIIGLNVQFPDGEFLGPVTDIISAGGNDIYVVKGDEREFLIPATYEVITRIDADRGVIVISPLEGLLELNEV